jgi:hypothetical protein
VLGVAWRLPLVSPPWAVLTAQSLSFVWTLSLNSRRRVLCESLFFLVRLPACVQTSFSSEMVLRLTVALAGFETTCTGYETRADQT